MAIFKLKVSNLKIASSKRNKEELTLTSPNIRVENKMNEEIVTQAISSLKHLEDIDDIVEYMLIKAINIESFLEIIEKREDSGELLPKLMKVTRKMRSSGTSQVFRSADSQEPILEVSESIPSSDIPSGNTPVSSYQSPAINLENKISTGGDNNNLINNDIFTSINKNDLNELVRREAWNSNYYFEDFEKEIRSNGIFKNETLAEKFVGQALLKFIRMINYQGKKFAIIKVSKHSEPVIMDYCRFQKYYSVKNKSTYSYEEKVETTTNGVSTFKSVIVHKWYFELLNTHNLLTYYHCDWIPYHKWEQDPTWGTSNFNYFTPFKANRVNTVNESLFQPILYHLYDIWANQNKDHYMYILSWIHHLIAYPRKWLPMITLVGAEGCGKTSIIVDFIFKYIFGEDKCIEVASIDRVVTRFNGHLAGKYFVYISELQSTESKDGAFHRKMTELKPYITDPTYPLEKKNIDVMSNRNFMHFCGSTNHETLPLRLTDKNRRHVPFRTSDKRKDDKAYFDSLYRHFNQEAADHFYTWICGLDKNNLPNPYVLPKTDIMNEIIFDSLPRSKQFIHLLTDDEIKLEISSVDLKLINTGQHYDIFVDNKDDQRYRVSKAMMYKLYTKWCSVSGGRNPGADNYFHKDVGGMLTEAPRIHGGPRCYYILKEWFHVKDENKQTVLDYLGKDPSILSF
jgi:hypothetical protein